MSLQTESEEVEYLISQATYPGVTTILQKYANELRKKATEPLPTVPGVETQAKTQPVIPRMNESIPSKIPDLGLAYVAIESFAWDQGIFTNNIKNSYSNLLKHSFRVI